MAQSPDISRRNFLIGSAALLTGATASAIAGELLSSRDVQANALDLPLPQEHDIYTESGKYRVESAEAITIISSVIDQFVNTQEAPEFWDEFKNGLNSYTDPKGSVRLGFSGYNIRNADGTKPRGILVTFEGTEEHTFGSASVRIEDSFNPLGERVFRNRDVLFDIDPRRLDPEAYSQIEQLPIEQRHSAMQAIIGKHFKEPFTQFLGIWDEDSDSGERSFINTQGNQMHEGYWLDKYMKGGHTSRIIFSIDYPIPPYAVETQIME